MRRILLFSFALLFIFSLKATGQTTLEDSHEVLLKGVGMYEKEEYKRAIDIFRTIHECDTNYAVATYETILSLIADSQFVAAKQLAASAVGLRYGNKRDAMITLAGCYDRLKLRDSALMIYDQLMSQYPQDHQPYYEKGVEYFNMKDYDKAAEYFQKALIINPYHFRSHYMLGTTYTLQGRLTEALMASEAALLVTKNADMARQAISVISAIAEQTDSVQKAYKGKKEKYNNPSFDEIDQILNAKIAIGSSYKLKIGLNDNIFRQSQAMMEKLQFDAGDTSFAMQYYVPIFSSAFKNDMFEGFMLLTFSDFKLASVDALARRKANDILEAKKEVFPEFNEIQSTRELNFNKRKDARELYHYVPESEVLLVGETLVKGKETSMKGPVTVYRYDQTLLATGQYNDNGEKEGIWKYYYKSGSLMKEMIYRKNMTVDTLKEYFTNGYLSKVTVMDDKGTVLQEESYNYKGWKSLLVKKLSDKETEESTFTQSGTKEVTAYFNDKKIKDGEYTFYYDNGKPEKTVTFSNGNYNGPYKKYYESGALSEESVFENGKTEGAYIIYHENGKVSRKATLHNGKYSGLYEAFYENGQPEEVCTYERSKKNGTDKRYSPKGKLYAEFEYDDDIPTSIKYYDEDNKVVYEKASGKGIYEYISHFPNGNKYADLKIDREGYTDGEVTYYTSTGAKSSVINYKKGNKEGKALLYFKSGKLKSEQNYKDDVQDGYCKYYYENGNVQNEGWYRYGKKQGLWKYYYINGKMQSERYYMNDYWNGYVKEYNKNGELQYKYMYDYNMLTACVVFDSSHRRVDSVVFPMGRGKYELPNKNGKRFKEAEGQMNYGDLTGLLTIRYLNGNPRETIYYRMGNRDSLNTVYFPDGKVESVAPYKNGYLSGRYPSYDEVGSLLSETEYLKGEWSGKHNIYACGRMYISSNYKEGDRDGATYYYGENGRVACVLYYDAGDIIGYSHEGKDGKLLPMIPVKNGTANIRAFYSNGSKSAEINVDQNRFDGTCKIYYSNGNVSEERNCKMGYLEGAFKRFTFDGKLVTELVYKDGEEMGPEKTYDKNGALLISRNYYLGTPHGPTIVTDPVSGKAKTYTYHYGELINVTE